MHYHSNHIWCRQSHWDHKHYDCRHLVSFEKYIDYKTNNINPDWEALITTEPVFNQDEYEFLQEMYGPNGESDIKFSDDKILKMSMRDVSILKPEVIDWLNENVPLSTDKARKDRPEGWCMGDSQYRMTDSGVGFTVFFLRRRDAMKFIEHWSVHKKPTTFLNYFDDDYRELKEGRLVPVQR